MGEVRPFPPAVNGVEQRLDAIYDELRALRPKLVPKPPESPAGTVELREPGQKKSRRPHPPPRPDNTVNTDLRVV